MMWKDAYVEGRVLSADPMELIRMLYQYGLDAVRTARTELAAGNIAARSRAISQAISALAELSGALNHSAGGSLSANLEQLYHYMSQRLFEANLKQADEPLAEIQSLLANLAEAWNTISKTSARTPTQGAEPLPQPNAWQESVYPCAHGWSA